MRADAVQATAEALASAGKLVAHIDRLRVRLSDVLPIGDAEAARDDDTVERIHAFLRMFEQLHDLIQRRLFRGAIAIVEEDAASLSVKALAIRLASLGAIPDADRWFDLGAVRNKLVHEYPLTTRDFAAQANAGWDAVGDLLAAFNAIASFLAKEGLPS